MEKEPRLVYAPNSIYLDVEISGKLPLSELTLVKIEKERLADFLDFLFHQSEHCDHISYREAWEEFEKFELTNYPHLQKQQESDAIEFSEWLFLNTLATKDIKYRHYGIEILDVDELYQIFKSNNNGKQIK